jgi:hypothetical protein
MAIANTPTLLSLSRYAKIMSLNPVHFSGAAGTTYWPEVGSCDDIWPQYSWQHHYEFVSREELATAIAEAEDEIKEELGFSPAPVWEQEEVHWFDAPEHHGIRYTPWVTAQPTSVQAEWGYIISAGERKVTLIEANASVALTDPDGDSWNELATVLVATSVTDKTQIKVYFAGHSGDPAWEIRPLKNIVIAGGTATITFDSWLALDPALWNAVPTATSYAAAAAIDVEAAGSYVDEVDVYQETTNLVPASAEFLWEKHGYYMLNMACPACSGAGCEVCALTTQDGCLSVRDSKAGIVTPFPATYDTDNSVWVKASMTGCRQPDQVKINYRAGHMSQEYLKGDSLDPLSDDFARAIAYLATARLERDVCACEGVKKAFDELQRDLTRSSRDAFYIRFAGMDLFNCPWGTRVGEVKAWNIIAKGTSRAQWDGGGF